MNILIDNLQYGDKLGERDHISLTFSVNCKRNVTNEEKQRHNFFKGNSVEIKRYLQEVKWDEMSSSEIDEAWTFFMHHVNRCIENNVPVEKVNKKFTKLKWMDHYCV